MRLFARSGTWIVVCCLYVAPPAVAGPTNPDISIIGDTRMQWTGSTDATLQFEEAEFALVGPVNPYASAEVYVGVHDISSIEIEEAKLLLDRYLPGGLGLTVGRMLQDFGQLNVVHSHAYPFMDRPLMHQRFFSDDGLVDSGVRLDWTAPVDAVTVRATGGVVRGDVLLDENADPEHHPPKDPENPMEPNLGVSGRLDVFLEPSLDSSFLLGVSVLHGKHDTKEDALATWLDLDAKGRWDLGGAGRVLVVNGEAVFGSLERTSAMPRVNPSGWFLSADLRADKRWNFGGFVESATERQNEDARTHRFGGFVGMALMEETTLFRLVGTLTDPPEGDSEAGVFVQAIFGLGPHRPHRY